MAYIASLDESERLEIAAAGMALEFAIRRDRSQHGDNATVLASFQQEMRQVEPAEMHTQLDMIGVYVEALDFGSTPEATDRKPCHCPTE